MKRADSSAAPAHIERGYEDLDSGSSSLGRALAILRAMSDQRLYSSLLEIHHATGLPKPSIMRLLQRLIEEGYVAKTSKRGQYRLCTRLEELSRGLDPVWQAIDVVEAHREFLAAFKWPIAIGTRDGARLVVLHSTRMPDTFLSFKPSTFGMRMQLLGKAMGETYLTHCGDAERADALADLLATGGRAKDLRLNVEVAMKETLSRGYGLRLGQKGESSTVAVPIFDPSARLIGVLALSAFALAVSRRELAAFARDLKASSAQITETLRTRAPMMPARH